MGLVNGLPKGKNSPALTAGDIQLARINNQFIITGTNPKFPVGASDKNAIVFLEYVQASGTFTVSDKNGNVLTGSVATPLDITCSPLRLDGGVLITGTILMAKGFYIKRDNLEA